MPKGSDFAYIGRLQPCGCVVAAMVDAAPDDSDRYKRDVAKEVATWIREGLTVERVTNDYVRQHLFTYCDACKERRAKKKKPAQASLFDR